MNLLNQDFKELDFYKQIEILIKLIFLYSSELENLITKNEEEKETESILETLKISKKIEKKEEVKEEVKQEEGKKEISKIQDEEDDDWAVPNFLRRSKIK